MIYDDNKTSAARIRTELPLALLRLKLEEENTSAARRDAVGWTERDELAEEARENEGLARETERGREKERTPRRQGWWCIQALWPPLLEFGGSGMNGWQR